MSKISHVMPVLDLCTRDVCTKSNFQKCVVLTKLKLNKYFFSPRRGEFFKKLEK
jgi:hypothetical protein